MPNVRVTCLLCDHTIEVAAADVVLHLGAPGQTPLDRYGFTCTQCDAFVVRRASRRVVEALVGTWEVQIATGAVPPWEQSAPPIDEADVLLFRAALADDAVLAAWVAAD